MKNYLKIGAVVQAIVIGLRLGLGKTQKYWKEEGIEKDDFRNPWFLGSFIITLIIGSIINIVTWPAGIICEIYDAIHKV